MSDSTLLEKTIGVYFKKPELLKNALIHRSYLNERKDIKLSSNEKLEFLGDSVLSLITSIVLFKNYPHLNEGDYTDIKATMVRTETLSEAAKSINLGKFIFLSKGEIISGGKMNQSILADCFEALIAAIFLDQDFDTAYKFVKKFLFEDRIDKIIESKSYESAKNRLQEYLQAKSRKLPLYKIISAHGPEHKKKYKIGVYCWSKLMGVGEGSSKKQAQEKAAMEALKKISMV